MSKEDYNREPVFYCADCFSLAIKELDGTNLTICLECGNSNIKAADIDEWNKLYVKEYGQLFLSNDEE